MAAATPVRRRLLALIAALSLAYAPTARADGAKGGLPAFPIATKLYNDLPDTHWAYPSVKRLADLGFFDKSLAFFHPEGAVTRADFVAWLMQLGGFAPTPECPDLVDVPCTAPYAYYVETARRLYIVDGSPDGRFEPGKALTRQEMYSLVVRTLGGRLTSERLSHANTQALLDRFSDWQEIASWARGDIAIAATLKIVAGDDKSRLRPQDVATRAEVAALLDRTFPATNRLLSARPDGGRPFAYQQVANMMTTAYATGEPGVGIIAYSGLTVRPGMLAVDPKVIPLGTLLFVAGYGYGFAGDIGGLITGQHVDLYVLDYNRAALRYGVQYKDVYVIQPVVPLP